MIEVVPYDPQWPLRFEAERRRLAVALGPVAARIEHNGSTAVPGLAAKPVIDIQISVVRLHPMDAYRDALAGLGYVHVPHEDDASCPFFHKPADWPHAYHVHVVAAGGDEERRTLTFRDRLRESATLRREYEELKRVLAARFAGGDAAAREAYASAKTDFVERVLTAGSD